MDSPTTPEPVSLVKSDARPGSDPQDVGDFEQGSPLSQWALARYLVGRAIAESVGASLLVAGLVVLALAALLWWAGGTGWAVLVAIVAVIVLAVRALLLALVRRLTAVSAYAPIHDRLRALVRETRKDVLRELRRVGLPGRTWTLPLLVGRLIGPRRRRATLARLRQFELDRVVPRARLDELHMLLRAAVGQPSPRA
jgi:hypothetical protein